MKTFTSKKQSEQRVEDINLHRSELPPMLNFCEEDLFSCDTLEFVKDLFVFKFSNELFAIDSSGAKVFAVTSLDLRKKFGGARRKYASFMKDELAKFLEGRKDD